MKNYIVIFLLFVCSPWSFCQENNTIQRKLNASKLSSPIKIDGVLSEADWSNATPATDFLEFDPEPGDSPSQKTEVRVLYDNTAIYIGAHLYDTEPDKILRQLTLRDDVDNASLFTILIDTYQSGTSASVFAVSAAGVQFDAISLGSDQGEDENWDAVWESEISFDEKGWYVEMAIPYFALRFPANKDQIWNINFFREIRRTREQVAWNPIHPEKGDILFQLGRIEGIKDIKPPIRLSLTPYVSLLAENGYDASAEEKSIWGRSISGGIDLKYGINEAYTLDMTLIPDFSEVRSDDQVLNLTPFEVRFDENRPFFTEGTDLFNKRNLFYSRRVGARPILVDDVEGEFEEGDYYEKNPQNAQLLNAFKLSGRGSNGLGVGLFNAIEDNTYAMVVDTFENKRKALVGPLTNYSVLVFDQLLANNSNAWAMNTNVMRSGSTYDANVSGGGFTLNNKNQSYQIAGSGALSQLYETDTTRFGHAFDFSAGKISGNWKMGAGVNVISEDYDPNDMGFIFSPNEKSFFLEVNYNKYENFGKFAAASGTISYTYSRLFAPDKYTSNYINFSSFFKFKTFDAFGFMGGVSPTHSFNYFEPRTDDFSIGLRTAKNVALTGWVSTDYRKPFAIDARFGGRYFDEPDHIGWNFTFEPRFRFNDKLSMIFESDHNIEYANRGYVDDISRGIAIGTRDLYTIENNLKLQYILNAKLGINLRWRHYWRKVDYTGYYILEEDGDLSYNEPVDLADLGKENYDITFSFFNIDTNVRWRFAPGSDLIFTWKNFISYDDERVDRNYWEVTHRLADEPISNSFSLKVLYFLDYNEIKNRSIK